MLLAVVTMGSTARFNNSKMAVKGAKSLTNSVRPERGADLEVDPAVSQLVSGGLGVAQAVLDGVLGVCRVQGSGDGRIVLAG